MILRRYLSPLAREPPWTGSTQCITLARVRRNALIVAAAMFVLALSAPAADATHVQCGDVLTVDTRLDSDLDCAFLPDAEGTALTIAASGVTLDLGGHSVTGPPFFSDTAGIAASGAGTRLRFQRQMEAQLFIHLAFNPIAKQQRPEAFEDVG